MAASCPKPVDYRAQLKAGDDAIIAGGAGTSRAQADNPSVAGGIVPKLAVGTAPLADVNAASTGAQANNAKVESLTAQLEPSPQQRQQMPVTRRTLPD